jgi:hypothetical protein
MGEGAAGPARRNGSLWGVAGGIVLAVLVGMVSDARYGAYTLAGVLVVGAVVRAVRPEPGPAALGVRRRLVDVAVLTTLAVALAVLAAIVPGAA